MARYNQGSGVEPVILSDDTLGDGLSIVQFVRHYVYKNGLIDTIFDTEIDGVTAYTALGTIINGQQSEFESSDESDCTVLLGATESDTIDLGRSYAFILIACEDTESIEPDTTMTIKVSPNAVGIMRKLRGANLGAEIVSETLPDAISDTFQSVLIDAIGIRRIQLTLSDAVVGDVVFKIMGVDAGKTS